MSFTRKTTNQVDRPTNKYVEYSSSDAEFNYYDKASGEDVAVDFETKGFIVLDYHLASVTGYSEDHNSGIFSNEVRTDDLRYGKDDLNVRIFGKKKNIDLARGPYTKIKEDVKAAGGKYTRCIYAIYEGEIIHIKLSGSAFQFWSDEIEKSPHKIHEHYVKVSSFSDEKKGSVKYKAPHYSFGDKLTEDEINLCVDADKKVQDYLDQYLSGDTSSAEPTKESPDEDRFINGVPISGYSFSELKALKQDMEDVGADSSDANYQAVLNQIKLQDPKEVRTPKGERLGDMDPGDIQSLISHIESKGLQSKHSKLYNAAKEVSSGFDEFEDDDDIPF